MYTRTRLLEDLFRTAPERQHSTQNAREKENHKHNKNTYETKLMSGCSRKPAALTGLHKPYIDRQTDRQTDTYKHTYIHTYIHICAYTYMHADIHINVKKTYQATLERRQHSSG
jgi:hypothetical protein